jgi:hypothetical protein
MTIAPADRRRHIRNVRITDYELKLLNNYAKLVERNTGVRPTQTWVIRELWRLGVSEFERLHLKHLDLDRIE